MNKRSMGNVFLILLFGTMIGTLTGELLGFILPQGVVKDFFLTSVQFELPGVIGDENGVVTIDLLMFTLKFGLKIVVNFTSIIALAVSYYFLRYFR